jgi:hypothetical protein
MLIVISKLFLGTNRRYDLETTKWFSSHSITHTEDKYEATTKKNNPIEAASSERH